MVTPVTSGAVQETSSAGGDSPSNGVRVTVGAAGWPGPMSVTSMVTSAEASCPCTVHFTFPV